MMRADLMAGDPRRHHHHPGRAHEGQGWHGARTFGAAHVGDAGDHRFGAARTVAGVPVLVQGGQVARGDDRPDEARPRPAHAADLGRWPAVAARIITPSHCRIGPTTICDERRSLQPTTLKIPREVAEAVLAHRPPASSASITGTNSGREARGAERMGGAPRVHRQPGACRARQDRQDAAAMIRVRPNRQRGLCQRWARLPVARLANPFKTGPWRGIAALNSMLSKKKN